MLCSPASTIRPWGVPGLLIDEVEADALFVLPRGTLAEVRSGAERFLLREGDELFDGTVERIARGEGVTFRQVERDPTALEPFQRVVRRVDPRWSDARITKP